MKEDADFEAITTDASVDEDQVRYEFVQLEAERAIQAELAFVSRL